MARHQKDVDSLIKKMQEKQKNDFDERKRILESVKKQSNQHKVDQILKNNSSD